MSDQDSDSEDPFEFKSKKSFGEEQEEKKNEIVDSLHLKVLNEISGSFFQKLQSQDFFNHKATWRSFSDITPIKISINTQELIPGICDMIRPTNNFLNKVAITFNALFIEIENTFPTFSLNIYESLYPLALYGERLDEDENYALHSNKAENQIARMLSYFYEIYERIQKLLLIGINLFNQIISLYSTQNNPHYDKSFKDITINLPFDYMGKIFSYFLAIDTIVNSNQSLKDHWDKYREVFHQCKNNSAQVGLTEENKKKIEKVIKKVNGGILGKICYKQCVEFLLQKTGLISPNESGMGKTIDNKVFNMHFKEYMKDKLEQLEKEIGTFNETNEQTQLFQYMALFGIFAQLYRTDKDKDKDKKDKKVKYLDKNILRSVWAIQKKVTTLPIVGNVIFSIEDFLSQIKEMKSANPEPKDVKKKKMENFEPLKKNFPTIVNNLRINIMTWVSEVENEMFEMKVNLPNEERSLSDNKLKPQLDFIKFKTGERVKLILYGLSIANYLRLNISYILETYVLENLNITPSLITTIANGLEIIKVIQSEYYRLMPYIALHLNIINRYLLYPLQDHLKQIIENKNEKESNGKDDNTFYKDVQIASMIMFNNTQASPSKMRRLILQFCFEIIAVKQIFSSNEIAKYMSNFKAISKFNQMSKVVQAACDCSFLYQYQNILPICFKSIFNERPKRIFFFAMAVNDMEIPLTFNKYDTDNGVEMIKNYRKQIFKLFEDFFLKLLCTQIENDLRCQVHSYLIKGLISPKPTDVNYKRYLTIRKFTLFDNVIDVQRYVEEYLNMTFYKLTTMNINDWKTYQQMRVLAKSKYGLNLHEVFLPSQSLDQGKDIIQIIRKLSEFVQNYTHNLHSQLFIEKNTVNPDLTTISVIGVQQILNSLYTHGTGIINSIVNATFQFLGKALSKIIVVIGDEFIKSRLYDERKFWEQNKASLGYKYPLKRGEDLLKVIEANSEQYSSSLILQLIKIIKQIGNAISLIRCIRTASMDYNSQNSGLLTMVNIKDFQMTIDQIKLEVDSQDQSISPNLLSNIQNAFNDAHKIFIDTISSLKQEGDNKINYLSLLVKSLGEAFSKVPDIELFAFLFTALTITHMENVIVATDNLSMNKKDQEMHFSDDGFIVGICYCLKVFRINKFFDTLNWFPSVVGKFEKDMNEEVRKKNIRKLSGNMDIKQRKAKSYLDGFNVLYFTYSSATLLFNE